MLKRIKAVIHSFKQGISQEMPEQHSACEECRKPSCTQEEYETCKVVLGERALIRKPQE